MSRKSRSRIARHTRALLLTAAFGQAVVSAQDAPKAVPIGEPVPRAVPVDPSGVPKAVPVNPPQVPSQPAVPTAPAVPGTQPAKKEPDEDLYDYATLCYAQKDYQLALKPYSDYTRLYPQGPHAAEAWFRLGECHLKVGQNDEAKQAYANVVTKFPKSESAASASYRLGSFAYNGRDFGRAAQYFETCEKLTTDAAVKLAAIYNKALANKMAGLSLKALAAYKAVAAIKGDNPYRESALSEVANIALQEGRKEEALAAYTDLIGSVKESGIVGDALIKSGLILVEQGKSEAGLKNFKKALEIKELTKDARSIAVFGLIKSYYAKGDYDAVVETYVGNAKALPSEDLRAQMFLMVANSQKQKQGYRQAIELYLEIEREYPDSREAFEAGYQKLLCFYQLGDKDIPQFTKSFEERYAPRYKDSDFIGMSKLIRADWYFAKADYNNAAEAFGGVNMAKVPGKVRGSVLYKKGFAETEAGKFNDGIASLTDFINDYSKDPNIPVALAQRGMCYKSVRSFEKALDDFTNIIKNYQDGPALALEEAYYQSGLIKAETRDNQGMIASFESLVSKFPKSAAAADAYFQIGRGYFELKTKESYAKALEPLRKAIESDSKKYLDKGHSLLISCQYLREDVDGAAKEIDAYLEARPEASISPAVLLFVGAKYYERGNYRAAARYLTKLSTPKDPMGTESTVWNLIGLSELENGNFEASVQAFENFLTQVPSGEGHEQGLLGKGRALLGLGKFDDADACATEALSKVKEGRLHARLQLLQGDVAKARGDALEEAGDHTNAVTAWRKAAGNYVVVSQIFVDPAITPQALDKGAEILEKLGEKDKAESLRKMLSQKYPNYKRK